MTFATRRAIVATTTVAKGAGASTLRLRVAALLCVLIYKLNTNGFLYLKLLSVNVYLLAKTHSDTKEEEPTPNVPSASRARQPGLFS